MGLTSLGYLPDLFVPQGQFRLAAKHSQLDSPAGHVGQMRPPVEVFGQNRFAPDNFVTELDLYFRIASQVNIHPRTELNQADALTATDNGPGLPSETIGASKIRRSSEV